MSTGQAILAAMTLRIRPTTLNDIAALPAIERAAAGRFRDFPALAWLADGEVISAEQHLDYVERGLSWLALANDQPVGFILAEAHPSSLFIVELSVDLDWQGKGIGRLLIARVADHARNRGLTVSRMKRAAPCACLCNIARWRCAYRAYKTTNRRPGKA